MEGERLRDKLREFLNEHLVQHRGYLGQEPYKKDLFRLFKLAYEGNYFDVKASPRLTGDALRDWLQETWLAPMDGDQRERAEAIAEDLLRRWDEWRYAWDQMGRGESTDSD